jgi:hypothetical protein
MKDVAHTEGILHGMHFLLRGSDGKRQNQELDHVINKTDDIQKLREDADESAPCAHVLSNTTCLEIAIAGGVLLVRVIVFVVIF